MKITLDTLSDEEISTLAKIRLSVTAHLVAAAASVDKELIALCSAPFGLTLSAIGVRGKARLVCGNGRVAAWFGEEPDGLGGGPSGGKLVFASARACARALAGGRGTILPLPTSPAFGRALRFFKTAAVRAPQMLRSPDLPAQDKARLLLTATLRGLEAVAGDSYLEKRMHHFPDGRVQIEAGDARFLLEKKGRAIRVGGTARDGAGGTQIAAKTALDGFGAAPPRGAETRGPDAFLTFASPGAAIAVLAGKRQAVVALGAGEVAIAGLLPLVQGLFAVLDRLSWYLGVSIGEEEK